MHARRRLRAGGRPAHGGRRSSKAPPAAPPRGRLPSASRRLPCRRRAGRRRPRRRHIGRRRPCRRRRTHRRCHATPETPCPPEAPPAGGAAPTGRRRTGAGVPHRLSPRRRTRPRTPARFRGRLGSVFLLQTPEQGKHRILKGVVVNDGSGALIDQAVRATRGRRRDGAGHHQHFAVGRQRLVRRRESARRQPRLHDKRGARQPRNQRFARTERIRAWGGWSQGRSDTTAPPASTISWKRR